MQPAISTGVYGKLPAHGDFICRDLPAAFVDIWDDWLQHVVSASQEQIGDDWLQTYLTSPIWRFILSVGVIDQSAWAGILIPSVDRVGRYFPFSVITQLPDNSNPLDMLAVQNAWYQAIEEVSLDALERELVVDDLLGEIGGIELIHNSVYSPDKHIDGATGIVVDMDFEEQHPLSVFPQVLDPLLADSFASYSMWSTEGSECVAPCIMATKGLPPISGIAAMMDGCWQKWNWQQPYRLNTLETTSPAHD
jgi:type VI secretion system protein ImpM